MISIGRVAYRTPGWRRHDEFSCAPWSPVVAIAAPPAGGPDAVGQFSFRSLTLPYGGVSATYSKVQHVNMLWSTYTLYL